jgi:hypothetical protein
MRCYICDAVTEYVDPRDGKPICDDCREAVRVVLEEWMLEDEEVNDNRNDKPT